MRYAPLLALCFLTLSCRHIDKPTKKQSLIGQQTLYSARDASTTQGDLLLLEDGLWALVEPNFPVQLHTVLSVEGTEDTERPHLFVVASIHDWGAILQRLSKGPFDATRTHTIAQANLQSLTLERHGATLCMAAKECAAIAPRAHAYPVLASNLNLSPHHKPRTTRYTLPFHYADPAALKAPYLLIPTERAVPKRGFIALVDDACEQELVDALSLGEHAITTRAPLSFDAPPHPLDVDVVLARHGADVALDCREEKRRPYAIFTPALARPWLPSRTAQARSPGPPLLAAEPIFPEREVSALTLSQLMSGAGLAARGHFSSAAREFERALFSTPSYSNVIDDYAIVAAQIIALDAPEQALHIAWHATRQSWRRDAVLEHGVALLAIYDALGLTNNLTSLEGELAKNAQSQRDNDLSDWVTWRALQQMIRARDLRSLDDFATITPPFHAKDDARSKWDIYTLLGMLLSPLEFPEETTTKLEEALTFRAERLGLSEAISSYMGAGAHDTSCDETLTRCLPDIYGHNLSSSLHRPERVPPSDWLTLPRITPYMAKKAWEPRLATTELDIASTLALALALGTPDALQIAPLLATHQANNPDVASALIDDLFDASRHRDRLEARALLPLFTAAKHAARRPTGELANVAKRSLERADRDTIAPLFLYWQALLFAHPEALTGESIEVMIAQMPTLDPPVDACVALHLARALGHMREGESRLARDAHNKASQCIDSSRTPPSSRTELDLEIVHAMLTVKERGALPSTRSKAFAAQLAKLEDTLERDKERFCAPIFMADSALHTLLPPSLRSLYTRSLKADDKAKRTTALRTLSASQRAVMAQETLEDVRALIDDPPPKIDSRAHEAKIMALLADALELAREARAEALFRRVDFTITALSAVKEEKTLLLRQLEGAPLDPLDTELLALARALWSAPSDDTLSGALDALSHEVKTSAPVVEMCSER